MQRRDLVRTAGAAALGGLAPRRDARAAAAARSQSPNIMLILVDELRFPSAFPPGIATAGDYLAVFMPNLHRLWRRGVKFTNHYSAGIACTPARGCLITGLYTQQSWLIQTVLARPYIPVSLQPPLNPAYPTYGSLLRTAGYRTPYFGKWHVSVPGPQPDALDAYGFDYRTYYDPTGANLQGTVGNGSEGYNNDQFIADTAVAWLGSAEARAEPWCATVSFINPHDKEFFWAGTEFTTYNALFQSRTDVQPFTYYSETIGGQAYEPLVDPADNPLANPPPSPVPFPSVPDNWESTATLTADKPSAQLFSKLFTEAVWGGVTDDTAETGFTVSPYPIQPATGELAYGIGLAPFAYWQRGQDCYAQTMTIVDARIGEILDAVEALPPAVRDNTVVVFTSDHGEYAGAHGFISGKVGTVYDEAFHVPLIVADRTGRFTRDIEIPRTGLTSSVDLLRMLVTIGNGGSTDWLTGIAGALYGKRQDLVAMLGSPTASGRPYVLLATDEVVPGYYNFNNSPTHILGLRTEAAKLGTYANWTLVGNVEAANGLETEFYDYGTEAGRLELSNLRDDPRIAPTTNLLLGDLVPNELRAPLPAALQPAQLASKAAALLYDAFVRSRTQSDFSVADLRTVLGLGQDF